jgi:Uma2 family endonuclease
MTVATKTTIEEFLERPDTKPASEYACGRVFQKPMPTFDHSAIQGFMLVVLFQYLARTGFGRVLPELRCIFGPSGATRIFVPDLCVVAKERLPTDQYLYAAPDVAIEILSPDQNRAQFIDKIQFYLLHGVRLVWIVDPATSLVTVQKPGDDAVILGAGETLDGGDVLPGFSVAVDEIFAQMQV